MSPQEEAARWQAVEVFGAAFPLAEQYAGILATRGLEWGLMGPREGDKIWHRHVFNSAAIASLIPQGVTVADVGSGAGLPGLPVAILRPDLLVTLIEPLARRATFLELAVDELGLGDRVRVVRARAEEHREVYDVVTCRAVANLTKLLGWTAPLFDTGDPRSPGRLVALKGESAPKEVVAAAPLLRELGLDAQVEQVRVYHDAEPTFAIVVTPTPAR